MVLSWICGSINALFILFHFPLTLSNIFATTILFFCCWKLGQTFKLKQYYALLFALTIVTLNVVLRWLNSVSIDIWIAVFYILAIILLENPQRNLKYFIKLGFAFGMLIGSKYTAWFFLITLAIFYLKQVFAYLTIRRVLAFMIPFSIFGLFWYLRNYYAVNNPIYPISLFGFQGVDILVDILCGTSHYGILWR